MAKKWLLLQWTVLTVVGEGSIKYGEKRVGSEVHATFKKKTSKAIVLQMGKL